jgi:hypothetical protein
MGMVERLEDGYVEGTAIEISHSSLPNSVPVAVDKFRLGGFFSIGFNLKGKENRSFFEKIEFN